MTTTNNDELRAVLSELVSQRHTWRYIAVALNRRGIQNTTRRAHTGAWTHRAAERAARRLGITSTVRSGLERG